MYSIYSGGWCYSDGDCASRAKTGLGSSKYWASTGSMAGMLSNNCQSNPRFCNWNKVWMPYCDGTSFSGNNADPVYYAPTNSTLYFNGHNNIQAIMAGVQANVINAPVPFSKAYDITLTGKYISS